MRARLSLGLTLCTSLVLAGCPSSSTEDVDAGPRADALVTAAPDARVQDAAPGLDVAERLDSGEALDSGEQADSGGEADSGEALDSGDEADATTGADVDPARDALPGPDVAPSDGGGQPLAVCQSGGFVDGVVHGRSPAPITFAPGSAGAVTITPLAEPVPYVSRAVSRVTPAGHQWTAQVTLATMFDNLELDRVLHDPSDGSTYAAFEAQHGGVPLRVYTATGALAAEFTAGGARGRDLVGGNRQSNFILVRYDADGDVVWATRFGPDRNGGVAGTINGLTLAGGRLAVTAGVEDSTSVVFGPGTPGEYSRSTQGASTFTADFSTTDGAYVAGSARFAERGEASTLVTWAGARGDQLLSSAGEHLFALTLRVSGPTLRSVRLGVGGTTPVTVSSTVGALVIGKLSAAHEVTQVFTVRPVVQRTNIDATAVAIAPSGVVVVGGLMSRTLDPGSPVRFTGSTGAPIVEAFDGANGFLAVWNADGSLRYVRRIAGQNNYPANQVLVDEPANAFYVVTQGTVASIHDPSGPSPFTPRGDGWSIVRYDLTTGRPQWGRTASPNNTIADMYSASLVAGGVAGQLFLTESNLWVGAQSVRARASTFPMPGLARLHFAADGSLVDCTTVVDLLNAGSWF